MGDDGRFAGLFVVLEQLGGVESVHVGQADVHQDDVGVLLPGRFNPLAAGGHGDHLVPLSLEAPGEHIEDHGVVIDDQNAGHQQGTRRDVSQASGWGVSRRTECSRSGDEESRTSFPRQIGCCCRSGTRATGQRGVRSRRLFEP